MKRYISLAIEKEIYDRLSEWCKTNNINLIRKGISVIGSSLVQYFNMKGDTSDFQKLKTAFPEVIETGVAKLGNILDCDSVTLQNFCGILKAQEEALEKEQFAESWFTEFINNIDSVEGLREIEKYNLTNDCRRILESRICAASGKLDPYLQYLDEQTSNM